LERNGAELSGMGATNGKAAESMTTATENLNLIEDVWLTREDVALRWKLPPKTLAQWASQHKGPPFTKIGRWCRYRTSDVVAWESRQTTGGDAA
jgi:hypothetical protein